MCSNVQIKLLCSIMVMLVLTGCPQRSSPGWLYDIVPSQIGQVIFGLPSGAFVTVGKALGESDGIVHLRLASDGEIEASGTVSNMKPATPEGGSGPSIAATVLSSGAVLVAANTVAASDLSLSRLRIIRINPSGGLDWDFEYGDDRFVPTAVAENSAGNILVAGNQYQGGIPYDAFLLLLAPGGDVLKFERMETLEDRSNFIVVRDATSLNESFFVVGWDLVEIGSDQLAKSLSVVEIGRDLDILSWTRTTGGVGTPARIRPLSDGFAVLARYSSRIQLLRTDGVGDVVSTRDDLFAQSNPDESGRPYDFIVDSSGDIVMVGEGTTVRYIGNFFPQITIRPFIAKFTPDGDKIWERSINMNGVFIYGVTETADGGYATTGAAPGATGDVLNVIRFDRDGNIIN
jgi:hypothetical protein